ncbi:hypothetical protein K4F52_000143 [Lecanicillium sp. MT-2017a]|nr:hypothetical protein K4F52_000143 [Lecanicillium sp. MT-2017a]
MESLEYKLRDASHIRGTVLDLLQDLRQSLEDGDAIIRGDATPWDQLSTDEEDKPTFPDENMSSTEIEQIMLDIKDIVDNLLRLNGTIRNAAQHDLLLSSYSTDTSLFENQDVKYVREMYPMMQPWQADRLGKSISRQRQYIFYRKARHEKPVDDTSQDLEDETKWTASSPFDPFILEHPELSRHLTDNANDESESESDGGEQTHFATSANEAGRQPTHIPVVPGATWGRSFEYDGSGLDLLLHQMHLKKAKIDLEKP